ncbi:MAG: PQQ-binding-like beta-propeller repeat protein [Myxococcales bacterium]
MLSPRWLRCCALVLGLARSANAAESPRTVFQFSASSTLFARPGLGRDGAVYVGSGDGYVHALAADGGFRWSYTVKGRVVAPPVEEPNSGRIFVATSEKRLYALEPDSHLRWVFPLPVAPKSELSLTAKGTLLFVGQDDYLYGVTTGGALSLRLAAAGARSAPMQLVGGQTGLVLGDAFATLKGYGYERSPLLSPFGGGAKLAVDANRAIFACEDGRVRAVSDRGAELEANSDCLSAPTRGDGFFAVAEAEAKVRLFYADGTTHTVALDAAPLRPIWDAARRRLILASATGSVRVLELAGGTP